jgi:hypothetical protein
MGATAVQTVTVVVTEIADLKMIRREFIGITENFFRKRAARPGFARWV